MSRPFLPWGKRVRRKVGALADARGLKRHLPESPGWVQLAHVERRALVRGAGSHQDLSSSWLPSQAEAARGQVLDRHQGRRGRVWASLTR